MENPTEIHMDDIPDELRELCLLWTRPGVFIMDKVKLAQDVEFYVRKREDKIRKDAAARLFQLLPEGYWDVIGKHLPKYHHRDDVLHSDTMTRIIEDEEIEDDVRDRFIQELGSVAGVELSLRLLDLELYMEAVEAMNQESNG
jgi:hypothetical protein